jgi:hypothetical protein
MVKREYQSIEDGADTDSLTPITKIEKEIIQDKDTKETSISSALTTPRKKAKSQSSKSTDEGVGEGPTTPKSKSPAKSVSPVTSLIRSLQAEKS